MTFNGQTEAAQMLEELLQRQYNEGFAAGRDEGLSIARNAIKELLCEHGASTESPPPENTDEEFRPRTKYWLTPKQRRAWRYVVENPGTTALEAKPTLGKNMLYRLAAAGCIDHRDGRFWPKEDAPA
jgi:hypothetical protein